MAHSTESHTRYSMTKKEHSSNWLDIINASEQKATEPIEKYLVSTVKQVLDEDGPVKRYTFGRKDPKRNRTILIVGETGTGKSTLINRMLNYMLGVKWEDNIRFEIIPDEDKIDETESKTIEITVYEIFGLEEVSIPFSLTVIDTPGFGDLEKDKSTAHNLYKLLKSLNGVQDIHAVCHVVKASQNRQTPSQKYIFHTILSLLGKNMDKSIMALITFSDWSLSSKAVELLTKSGVPSLKDNTFLFNNCPLQEFDKEYEEMYKTSWDNGAESFVAFSQALDKMEPQSLQMTVDILEHHQNKEACIQRLESQIMDVEQKREALQMLKELKEHVEKVVDLVLTQKTISTEEIGLSCNMRHHDWNWIKLLVSLFSSLFNSFNVKDHKENKIIVRENEKIETDITEGGRPVGDDGEEQRNRESGRAGVPSLKDNTFLSNNCPLQENDKECEEMYKTSWDNGASKMTVDILEPHQNVKAYIQRLESQIMDVEQKHKALEMQQETVKEHMGKVVDFVSTVKFRTEKIGLFCNVCQELCPFPQMDYWIDRMLSNITCSSCQCKAKDHKENIKIIVLENGEIVTDITHMKYKAESIITTAEKGVGKELEDAVTKKTELIDKCFQSISQLQKHALKFDFTHVDSLMKILEKSNEKVKVAELQEMMENKETEKAAELEEMLEKNKETEKVAEPEEMLEKNKETEKAAELQEMLEKNKETEKVAELQVMLEKSV